MIKPYAWLYENAGGAVVVHFDETAPKFLADMAAARHYNGGHKMTALYEKSAIDSAVLTQQQQCAEICRRPVGWFKPPVTQSKALDTGCTIDRSDPRFLQLLKSIYKAWENEKSVCNLNSNVDRIVYCLTNCDHGKEMTVYCQELVDEFSFQQVLRVLNKHINLVPTQKKIKWNHSNG